MVDTVKFDPGMGELVVDFNNFVNDVYSQLFNFKTIHQKRARFKLYINKIQTYMKNNISFYFGCLLWALYISKENSKAPKDIVGNVFLNLSEEQKEDYDYLIQVNFIENYFDSFERDVLYYTGQKIQIPNEWRIILELYSEFLELNKGFVNTTMTSDIVLPEKIENLSVDFNIDLFIQEAIKNQDLSLLLNKANILL